VVNVKTWNYGDIITAEDMNRLENKVNQGIEEYNS
jgi:hypothetical protein